MTDRNKNDNIINGRLLSLMRDSEQFYIKNLYSYKAEPHLEYLNDKNVGQATMKEFGLGASLDFRSLPQYLLDIGYTAEECEESGVCVKANDGKLIDAQGGRLIFPIHNYNDNVIAFGGRALVKTDCVKFKTTRDTVLFNKSENLYNINLVEKLMQYNNGVSSLIIVEGFMDVISLYQAGFKNVVASMGTSLTNKQALLCKRYTHNVFISYDGDFVGRKASLRGVEIMKQAGVNVRIIMLPDNLDPIAVIKQNGADGYQHYLDSAI